MSTKTLQVSFSGGEIAPEVYGRIDDAKYRSGLATCRNFRTRPQGPIENRAGFRWVTAVKDSTKKTRLIPFTYSTTQTMVIELGAGYFRFHSQGAVLATDGALKLFDPTTTAAAYTAYEIANPYAEQDLMDIHYIQSGDVLTLTHTGYPPKELRRFAVTNWVLIDIAFTPTILPPTNAQITPKTGSTYLSTDSYHYQYRVTSIALDGITESVFVKATGVSGAGITGITNANPGVIASTAHGRAVNDEVYISGISGMTLSGFYRVGTVPDVNHITLVDDTGGAVNTTSLGTWTAGGTVVPVFTVNNVFVAGGQNTITWTAATGASRYNVYKSQGGVYGFIGSTTTTSFVDDNIAADMSKTPPTYDTIFASSTNYPAAVSYYEQRRVFGGTITQPQNLWMTKSATESVMSYSLPVRDDDRIAIRVAAREANTIRHIVPMQSLVLLTSAAEWRVTSVNSDAITPTSISVKPQSYIGANNVQPVLINTSLIYASARGGHVRELQYAWQANGFSSGDLSIRAPHLFDNRNILDMAYSKAPYPTVWMVSDFGTLLGLTYVPEQEIGSWHWHDTQGTFESICVVSEGNEDYLYAVIKRTINGSDVRYIERLSSRMYTTQADAFFVDAGATYNGAPTTTVSNLYHLEGMTVSIFADGAVHATRVVVAGSVRLDYPASKVTIGLAYTCDAQTLPMSGQVDNAFGQGRPKNINKVWVRVLRSGAFWAGPDETKLTEKKWRTTETYGTPPAFKTDEFELTVSPSWNKSGQLLFRQTDPTPLTIENVTLEVALGG